MKLGTTIRWSRLLPRGCRVESAYAALAGFSREEEVVYPNLIGGGHVMDAMRAGIRALGLRPQDTRRLPAAGDAAGPVVLCPIAGAPQKEWQGWSRIADFLWSESVPWAWQTPGTVADLLQQLRGSRAVVGVDSGPLHLADALDLPVVGIFTATAIARFGTVGGRSLQAPDPEEVVDTLRQVLEC